MDVMIRISRYDVNWNATDAATRVQEKVDQAAFEAAVYKLLHPTSEIKVSHLLFHRLPVWQVSENRNERPDHLIGRELFVFEKANGDNNCASIRAALFSFEVPLDFAKMWLPKCPPSAKVVPSIVAPTRDFAISFLVAKVEEMIKNEGDMIGWESDVQRKHDDFGIHNMTITDETDRYFVIDWETGHIVPAILSDPPVKKFWCDLVVDEDAERTRIS
ncbi:hypothetical protein B0H11DRAFT_1910712 [Mycena galericulata]|nr:hypothetical protein B0H11DRAFT_1910712 [Mycena galericulata]